MNGSDVRVVRLVLDPRLEASDNPVHAANSRQLQLPVYWPVVKDGGIRKDRKSVV